MVEKDDLLFTCAPVAVQYFNNALVKPHVDPAGCIDRVKAFLVDRGTPFTFRFQSRTPTPVEARTEPDAALLDDVVACERILWHPTGRKVLDYRVNERGLAPEALKANHVDADPGPTG